MNALSIDLLSASAHKFCGPKGAGLSTSANATRASAASRFMHGGGHEKGLRSGTLNVPAIVGLGAAAALCRRGIGGGTAALPRLARPPREGPPPALDRRGDQRPPRAAPRPYDEPELLRDRRRGPDEDLPEIAVSSSSACTSAAMQPSYVLGALGLDDARIKGSIRFSLGRFTTEAEIDAAIPRWRSSTP